MWSVLFIGLLLIVLIALYLVFSAQRQEIEILKKSLTDVQQEEHRVFDFLHGLGEAFSEQINQQELHRLIVRGAARILNAHGGALYLIERSGAKLVPEFISEGCPPLLSLPPHILEQAESTPLALESYLRLHGVAREEGLIGQVWASGNPIRVPDGPGDDRLAFTHNPSLRSESVMICPLMYGQQTLGVLALANGPMGSLFTKSDFEVFKAITEQSAFALYNAIVYAEAGEKKRLDTDLQTAREIQSILLPSGAPTVPGYDICGTTIPARHVSGDYYDYLEIGEHRTGVVIADVSGKGVSASLIMAMCRSVLRSHAPDSISPAEVLAKVNRQLYPDIREDMFVSMAYAVLNHTSPEIVFCRAGHDAPLHYKAADQSIDRLNPRGMAIGIDSGEVFGRVSHDFTVSLAPGDCLILYTDGMTEAVDDKGFEFGMKRMMQSVQASASGGAAEIIRRLTDDLRNFAGNQPQYDDVTLIAIRRL